MEGNNKIMQSDYSDGYGRRVGKSKLRWVLLSLAVLIILVVAAVMFSRNHITSIYPRADQEQGTTFNGMSAFISGGLTTSQVNGLLKAFSKFAPTAKTISMNTDSLSPGPHDPNSGDPTFTIDFSVSIDSAPYSGTVKYSGLDIIRLFLYGANKKQIFDSGVINTNSSVTNPDYSSGSTE